MKDPAYWLQLIYEKLAQTGGAALQVVVSNLSLGPSSANIGSVEMKTYSTVKNGELQGSTSALQLPTITCKLVKFRARDDNAGNVYLGKSGVTKPDGTTDITTGYQLDAGEETGWIPVSNLNAFYRICDNAGDDLTYLALE